MARSIGAIDQFLTIWTDRIVAKKARDAASKATPKRSFWGNLHASAKCISPKALIYNGFTGKSSCSFMGNSSGILASGV
jgi:hypothetical protein